MKQLIFLLVLLCAVATQAVVIPQPPVLTFDKTATGTIPDLDQNRDYDGDLVAETKWCAPTASADCVWYYGSGSYPDLIPPGANDPCKADNMIIALGGLMGTSDAAGGTTVGGTITGLQAYYDAPYPGEFYVNLYTAWSFPDAMGAPSALNLWNWMANNLQDCNDVLPIYWLPGGQYGDPPVPPTNDAAVWDTPLDSVSGHLVMMIGYDYTPVPNPTITVYDPDDDADGLHAFPSVPPPPPAPVPVTSTVIPVGGSPQGTALALNGGPVLLVGVIISGPQDVTQEQGDYRDYGDAPEGNSANPVIAYPSLGVNGQFPTCITVGPSGWIQHDNYGAYFGNFVDFEFDGNAGACPGCFPPYDQDECFDPIVNNSDPGLIIPDSFTIDAANTVVPCPQCTAPGTSLGQTCNTAVWGTDIDIWVHNTMPNHDPYLDAYINVLIDWNQDGLWGGASTCPTASAPEHVLQNFVFPKSTINTLSSQMPPSFLIGPNSGYVWARFTITEHPVPLPWDGTGTFEDGESEDYLLKIDAGTTTDEILKFQQLPLDGPDYFGHDEISTAYTHWDFSDPCFPQEIGYEGCYMADDFADLEHSPVIKVRWWGSYPENNDTERVPRFLIAFERDIPAVGQPGDAGYEASHPGDVLYSEIVYLNSLPPLNPGEFSENYVVGSGGPPCNEALWEYEALLMNPFPQDPNTVYWLKIVALYDIGPVEMEILHGCLAGTGLDLCDYMNMSYSQQVEFCDELTQQLPRWGWHNRDYTKRDPYASTPPAVVPGEHLAGTIYDPASGADLQVWHFQDDAVSGDVFIDPYNNPFPEYPESPFVDQPTWQEEHYAYTWPWCTGTEGVDGPGPSAEHPEGIADFSKDLAFEIYTNDDCFPSTDPGYANWILAGKPSCWCDQYNCKGDADSAFIGLNIDGKRKWVTLPDLTILSSGWGKKESQMPNALAYCGDADRNFVGTNAPGKRKWVTLPDLTILSASWGKKESQMPAGPPCAGW